jgi:UDP-glucose 4-epimerase
MPQNYPVLVTGGAGYIGSHTALQLIEAGYEVVALDNLSNSHPESLRRVSAITGKRTHLVEGDVRDRQLVQKTIEDFGCQAVLHFAGLKAVGESVEKPLLYYKNNVEGMVALLDAMDQTGVRNLVFSSSATVYGDPQKLPLTEDHPRSATNPYGRTKLMIEEILEDLLAAQSGWRIAILRYFNPVGAHSSGMIGEDPQGVPNNLMPFIAQVATGRRESLRVFGNDYPTPDGTGMRDYIHVVDLAEGHVLALQQLDRGGSFTVNLGTGTPYSVLDVASAFEAATGQTIPREIHPRRPGDIACCYADPSSAKALLGWEAKRDLQSMCEDVWRWQSGNPSGYQKNS